MEHATKRHGNILILSLLEDLTFHQNDDFGALLHKVVHDNNADIIVDMTQVKMVDSMVAGHFVSAKRECDLNRRQFGLANVCDLARNILHFGGADHQVHLYRSIEEAIADLSDRSHGTRKRRLIMNIKCDHQDCFYFTYGKQPGFVVPACEYPYQDDITNGPTCKCYKADWQQIQENVSLSAPSPFRNAKKKSLYDVRNKAAEEFGEMENPFEIDHEDESVESTSMIVDNAPEHQEQVAARLNDPDLKPKIATAIDRSPPSSSAPHDAPSTDEFLPIDPFADDNFPSSTKVEPVQSPEDWVAPVVENPPVSANPTPPPSPKTVAPETPKPAEHPPADSPDQVVRKYIEAWNQGEFESEYQYLSVRNRAFSESDYVTRRQSLRTSQMQRNGGKVTLHEIPRVDSCAIDGVHSTVEITRVDRTPVGSKCYCQYFHLVLEDGFWKIQRSEDGEIRKNPIKPQKGRVMKAGDFLGKSK